MSTDTLHTCEACTGEGCPWCDGGLQNKVQFAAWVRIRERLRRVSGTYQCFEAILVDIVHRLNEDGTDTALVLAMEGQNLLHLWQVSTGDRAALTQSLRGFSQRALDHLQVVT